MSRDLADTIWLARPFHSEIVLTKNEFYTVHCLICWCFKEGPIINNFVLFYHIFRDTVIKGSCGDSPFVGDGRLQGLGVRYLSGGIAGIIPSTTLNKNDSLRFLLLSWSEGRFRSFSIFVTHPGSLEK